MATYILSSHDGYGLGHARRNWLIARALLDIDPDADITLITGIKASHWFFSHPGLRVVHGPPLVKNRDGSYRAEGLSVGAAIEARRLIFEQEIGQRRPDVIVVDRHPYGVGGELRAGLRAAKSRGAAIVLGLRAVLDDPDAVAAELAGANWAGVEDLYDEMLVYGSAILCDHEVEYGLPRKPTYCGFVTESAPAATVDPRLLVVAAGGGGDGDLVFGIGAQLLARQQGWRGIFAVGPYADMATLGALGLDQSERVEVRRNVRSLASLFATAGASLQMAGYNTTLEALGAGLRPILVPRRHPRREQAIQSTRLASMGLADVVDEGATVAEVEWLLGRPRRIATDALEAAGISLDGATRAARHLAHLARVGALS